MTNKEYAKSDAVFIECCALANIPSSRRQASKFRNGKGVAFSFKNQYEREKENDHAEK